METVQFSVQYRVGYQPMTRFPIGAGNFFNLTAVPTAEPRQISEVVWLFPVTAPTSGMGVARNRLHDIFRLLTADPRRVPASEARRDFAELINWSAQAGRPAIITNHGKPEVVVLSFALFERIVKSLARVVLGFRARGFRAGDTAQDIVEAEAIALSRRLRERVAN